MNARADLTTAHTLYEEKRFPEAETVCRALIERGLRDSGSLHLLGLIRKELGDLAESERLMRESIVLDPGRAEFRTNLGNLLRRAGRLQEAAEAYRGALLADSQHAPARLGLARTLVDLQAPAQAETECRKVIADSPQNAEAWSALARALQELSKLPEAEAAYRQAIALAPNYAAAHHNLGALLSRMELPEEALIELNRALALGARTSETLHNRGRALLQLYRIEAAEHAYAEAVALAPTNVESQLALANVRHMRGDPKFARDIAAAAAAHRDNDSLQMRFADVLRRAGDLGGAEMLLRDLLARRGPVPQIRSALATVLHEAGNLDEAELHALEAATARPHDALLIETLVTVLLSRGRGEDAQPFIATQRARVPHDQRWIAYAASAARLSGDPLYHELYDYTQLVRAYELPVPRGWSSMATFHADVQRALRARHRFANHPLDQSLRHGSQTARSLISDPDPVIQALLAAFSEPIAAYRGEIGVDADHPLRSRNHGDVALAGCWSVRLGRDGFHVNHIHPQGWISSAYYVSVPEEVQDAQLKSGWIKFGEPRFPMPGATPAHFVQPRAGCLVLFPSYMWHGTTPIHGDEPRISVAFDAIPIPDSA